MDTEEAILTRRSVRSYARKVVDREKLGRVLQAGRAAPCAGNIMNWFFIVVDDDAKKDALSHASFDQDWMAQAPLHIVLVSKPDDIVRNYGIRGERLYDIQGIAAVAENMLICAHAIGLGACWVSAFDEDKVKSILSIPLEMRPQAIITLGYATEQPATPLKHKIDKLVYWNSWWSRIKDLDHYMGYNNARKGKQIVDFIKGKLSGAEQKVRSDSKK